MSAAGLAVGPVVSAHYGFDICFFYACLKCGEIGLAHIFRCGLSIELMSFRFRSGVDSEMLCASGHLHVFTVALKSLDKRYCEP